jgi:hypothetical protein
MHQGSQNGKKAIGWHNDHYYGTKMHGRNYNYYSQHLMITMC